MKSDPRAIVAIILALVLLILFSAGSYRLVTMGAQEPAFKLVENILFTIVGALAGYIAGRDNAGS
jgi:hypothetical protein